ncbi:hypothetical protein C8R43DRAFT_1115015 [Mycena crocata]|nr:hypothetical protein C8R43DRAFT_1115015 [Mycena crocata]
MLPGIAWIWSFSGDAARDYCLPHATAGRQFACALVPGTRLIFPYTLSSRAKIKSRGHFIDPGCIPDPLFPQFFPGAMILSVVGDHGTASFSLPPSNGCHFSSCGGWYKLSSRPRNRLLGIMAPTCVVGYTVCYPHILLRSTVRQPQLVSPNFVSLSHGALCHRDSSPNPRAAKDTNRTERDRGLLDLEDILYPILPFYLEAAARNTF